jgi:tetratricopeptide (TPR) repeat protein
VAARKNLARSAVAKQRRVIDARSPKKKTVDRSRRAEAPRRAVAVAPRPSPAAPQPPPQTPPVVLKKPAYYEAIAIYETGVRALQKHDFASAAEQFRAVIQRYPDERELLERARLYLRVCERETANRPAAPRTPDERVYAATVALNAGDPDAAVAHLRQALGEAPQHDHGHYIMAVALCDKGDSQGALNHLRQAIELNPDNRSNARQDPDLAAVRVLDGFRQILDAPDLIGRRRPAPANRLRRG